MALMDEVSKNKDKICCLSVDISLIDYWLLTAGWHGYQKDLSSPRFQSRLTVKISTTVSIPVITCAFRAVYMRLSRVNLR